MPRQFETECVGMQYRVTPSTRGMMKSRIEKDGPMELLLIREHDNTADANAIKCVIRRGAYKGLHVGYLPRGVASVYAPALDKGKRLVRDAWLTSVDPDVGHGGVLINLAPIKGMPIKANVKGKPTKRKKSA